jgi:hypothetical protein
VTVAQGSVQKSLPLAIEGLDELRSSVVAPGGVLDVGALAPRYARIEIDSAVRFTGAQPVRLVATAELVVAAALELSGAAATNSLPGTGGPGGCQGGVREGPGQCLEGGGAAGGKNDGGGGGGHATAGNTGVGSNGGAGGQASGHVSLAPFAAAGALGARGHGGGGGGDGVLAGAGGPGGGGGGVIELSSQGLLRVTAAGQIAARGGAGAPGTGTCVLDQHGGGGGGGAGGAVLLRAAQRFEDTGSAQRVWIDGGAGGNGGSGCNAGGAGAPGRVRIDLPHAGDPPALVSGVAALYRGPVIAPGLAAVVDSATVQVPFFGGAGETYWIAVEGSGATPQMVTAASGRQGSGTASLAPGLNQLCVLVRPDITAAQPEGLNCISVAYIP